MERREMFEEWINKKKFGGGFSSTKPTTPTIDANSQPVKPVATATPKTANSSSDGIIGSSALSTDFKAAPVYTGRGGQAYEVTGDETVAKQPVKPVATATPKTANSSSDGIIGSSALSTDFKAAPVYTGRGGQAYEVTGDETVAKQLDNLLAKNSPYLQRAKSGALQTANARGLLNSSIAASSGEAAAIDAALPIAQQDAGYLQDLGKLKQQGIIGSFQQSQQSKDQAGLYGVQSAYESILSKQQYTQEKDLQAEKIAAEKAMQAAQISADELQQIRELGYRKYELGETLTANEEAQLRDLQSKLDIARLQIESEKELQTQRITAEEEAQLKELEYRKYELGETLTAEEEAQLRELGYKKYELEKTLTAEEESQLRELGYKKYELEKTITAEEESQLRELEYRKYELGETLTAEEESQLRELEYRKYELGETITAEEESQLRELEYRKYELGETLTAEEEAQLRELEYKKYELQTKLTTEQDMQLKDLEYRKYELGETLTAEEEAQLRELEYKKYELQTKLTTEQDMQLKDLEYRKYELGETLTAEEEAQLRDLQSKEKLAELERQTQIALQDDRIQADKELQRLADDAAAQRQQVEVDAEKFIKELELTQELEIEYMEDIRLTGQQFLTDYAKILVSPDFDSERDRNEALQSLTNQYEAELNLLASLAEGEVI
jgi:hypothetical protein